MGSTPLTALRASSSRKRGEGQQLLVLVFVAPRPACGERVAEGRVRGCPRESQGRSRICEGATGHWLPRGVSPCDLRDATFSTIASTISSIVRSEVSISV